MILRINKHIRSLLPLIGILTIGSVKSQTLSVDSLTLNTIISEVTTNHPMIKKAMEDLNVSDAKIGLAQSNYLPNVDFTSSYSRMGPISTIKIPDMGSFSFVTHDNYSAAFNVIQTIYDFGKTEKNVLLEKQGKELSDILANAKNYKLNQKFN